MILELEERFWSKVAWGGEGCWEWMAAKNEGGYGVFGIGQSTVRAHRLAYELEFVEEVPRHLVVDHRCRNRGCVNPYHLRVITSRENTLCGESVVASRARQTHCIRNHELSGANLVPHPHSRVCRECKKLRSKK